MTKSHNFIEYPNQLYYHINMTMISTCYEVILLLNTQKRIAKWKKMSTIPESLQDKELFDSHIFKYHSIPVIGILVKKMVQMNIFTQQN